MEPGKLWFRLPTLMQEVRWLEGDIKMTKRKVLIAAVAAFILMAAGIIAGKVNETVPLEAWAQIVFFCGALILFCLVFLPIVTTLYYPTSRDERRRRYPQMPDEELFEMLMIKDWKKTD